MMLLDDEKLTPERFRVMVTDTRRKTFDALMHELGIEKEIDDLEKRFIEELAPLDDELAMIGLDFLRDVRARMRVVCREIKHCVDRTYDLDGRRLP